MSNNALVAVIFSPHPDDECIIGALPLRLARECGVRVVNVAVTLGSLKERRAERLRELQESCELLGFELIIPGADGLDNVNRESRAQEPVAWAGKLALIREVFEQCQPGLIFFPHGRDWNSTHEGTHCLVMDSLRTLPRSFQVVAVETEFWHPLYSPNLMVEVSPRQVAEQMAAVSCHRGEIMRNPYHLGLSAWMRDNARRGAEVVGGQGCVSSGCEFATLYRQFLWWNGQVEPVVARRILRVGARPVIDHRGIA